MVLCMIVYASRAPAADCQVNPHIPDSKQYQCVMDHAESVYRDVCGATEHCVSSDARLKAAYTAAADLFDARHAFDKGPLLKSGRVADLERFAQSSQVSGTMNELASRLGKASNAFVACVELAERAYAQAGSPTDRDLSDACSRSNVAIWCAFQTPRPDQCFHTGPVHVLVSVETIISSGHVDSISADTTGAQDAKTTTLVEGKTVMPSRDEIDALADSLSDQDRRNFQSEATTKRLQIEDGEPSD